MTGLPFTMRFATSQTLQNAGYIGEPYFYADQGAFGVRGNAGMHWYPRIQSGNMVLWPQQKVIGEDSNGDRKVALSFDTPGALRIMDTSTNTVLASFSSAGASFSSASVGTIPDASIANILPGGQFEIWEIGNAPVSTQGGLTSPLILGPNVALWRKANSAGHLSVRALRDRTSNLLGIRNAIVVTAAQTPTDCGLRGWIFNMDELAGKKVTLSMSIKGPAGGYARMRIGNGGLYDVAQIHSDGAWHRYEVSTMVNPSLSTPLEVDYLYAPSNGEWRIAGPQVNFGGSLPLQFVPYSLKVASAASVRYAPVIPIALDGKKAKTVLWPPMQQVPDISFFENTRLIQVTALSEAGMLVSAPNANEDEAHSFRFTANCLGNMASIT